MNKGLKSAGWILVVVALIQSAHDLRGGLVGEVAAEQYASTQVGANRF